MKRSYKNMRFLIPVMAAFSLAIFSVGAFAQDTRVNLIFQNGNVLIYKAREAGYVEGQKLNVMRGSMIVGSVVVTSLQPTFAQAQIQPGSNAIQEFDVVVPAPGMPRTMPMTPSSTVIKKPEIVVHQEKEKPAVTPRKRSVPAAPPEAAPESSSETTRTSNRTSRSSRQIDEEKSSARSAPGTKPPKIQQPPVVIRNSSPYVIHIGKFYFNQHIPVGVDTSAKPSPILALDYWRPKDESRNIVYNLSYTRPESNYELSGRRMRSQLEIFQLSINYIWSGFNSNNYGETGLYGGVGAGYRSVSIETDCETSCDGLTQDVNYSISDVDYHGIVGYRFHKNYELKLDYCFDEDYYGITFGLGAKRKRKAVILEPEPEPAPIVRVVRKPKPVVKEEPAPEPEPEPAKTQAPMAIFKERPAKIEQPIIVHMSEPAPIIERNIYTYVSEPKLERRVIVLAFEDINFEFDKSTLTSTAQANLKRNIEILRQNPKAIVRIAGYTSASGTDKYNQKLSERRAKAVKDYLVKEGLIAADRLNTIGYGESNPETYEAAPKDLYSPAAKSNMRVLFEIVLQ